MSAIKSLLKKAENTNLDVIITGEITLGDIVDAIKEAGSKQKMEEKPKEVLKVDHNNPM